MSRVSMFLSSLAVLAFALGLTGCPSGGDSDQPARSAAAGHDHAGHDHGEGDHAGHDHEEGSHEEGDHAGHDHDEASHHVEGDHAGHDDDSAKIEAAMAELSDEDRALAVAQKTCPVSDGPLGSMGTPVKVTVKDRDVFLCCEHCRDAITEDPDKYLAKLDQ